MFTWPNYTSILGKLTQALRPAHEPDEQRSRAAHQESLDEKQRLLASRDAVLTEIEHRRISRRLLKDLRIRMAAVDPDAYVARIATIDDVLGRLEQQLDIDNQLVRAYDRSLERVGTEYGSAASMTALAELREVEERHAHVTRELGTNAEVEQLLRRTGP